MIDIIRSFARPLAERFMAAERLALRRWLRMNGIQLYGTDIASLERTVKVYGGDPIELREKGRDHMMRMIEKEYGGIYDA